MSLPRIGLEQTKDLVRIVSNKVASTKAKCGRCGMSEYNYRGNDLNGAWIDLSNKKSNIDVPVEVEAKINAVDLGFDIQSDLHHRLGIFASYRQGEYELSGMGEDYYSKVGSDIDIDSWMMGLYHRYDKGRIWTMSTLYAGLQKIDLTTDDGVSADTDGIQFGGSIEAGLVFEPQKRLTIEPSIRLGYNFIKYDDMSDRYGKTAQYDNIHNVEVEAGVKVEKTWFANKGRMAKLYIKPSVIQNFGKGDINITSLDTVEGLNNDTLLRGEIGGSFNFGNGWSGYGAVGHTFGDDYNATDYNLGIGYSW
jgi:outer membrane autotransporter protein